MRRRFLPGATAATVAFSVCLLSPFSVQAQLPGTTDDDGLVPALAVYAISIGAAILLFNPPEPTFSVTGSQLMTQAGQDRLSAYEGPVGIRRSGFGKWAVRSGDDVGMVSAVGAGGPTVERAGEAHTVAPSEIGDVTDLASAAVRAKELRTSVAILALGSAGAIFLLADGQPTTGGSKTLMQLSAAIMGALGVYVLAVPGPVEKLAAEYESTGRLAILPNLTWDREFGVGLGVAGRLTW